MHGIRNSINDAGVINVKRFINYISSLFKQNEDKELNKALCEAYLQGYHTGYNYGRFEAFTSKYSPNEIREILGVSGGNGICDY